MKRRLNIAAALVHDPDILIFDEPTVGVDPQSRNATIDNLQELRRRGKALLYLDGGGRAPLRPDRHRGPRQGRGQRHPGLLPATPMLEGKEGAVRISGRS